MFSTLTSADRFSNNEKTIIDRIYCILVSNLTLSGVNIYRGCFKRRTSNEKMQSLLAKLLQTDE